MSFSPALPLFGVDASMSVDSAAAGITFADYLNLKMGQNDSDALAPFHFMVSTEANEYHNHHYPISTWDEVIDCGRSYLVGHKVSLESFLARYTSQLQPWQKLAFRWALANPAHCLVLKSLSRPQHWTVKSRGNYVEFGLPHQDYGGEKHWISRDGRNLVLVNDD